MSSPAAIVLTVMGTEPGQGDLVLIDSHVHILPPRRLRGLVRWLRRAYPAHPVAEDVSAAEILDDMRAAGVSHFFNLAYPLAAVETDPLNDFNARFCAETPGAIPFASLHQDTEDKASVAERALARGAIGLKFHPFVQRFDPWDARMGPLYAFMEEAGRPVILHTGFEFFYGQPMPAAELIKLAARHPRLPLVFVHMAFPELEIVFAAMAEYPQLYLDATNVLACFREQHRPMLKFFGRDMAMLDVLAEGLTRFRGRILFGTDHPAGMGSYQQIYDDLDFLPVADEVKADLRGGAARAFIERFVPGFDWTRRL
jgi:uncharacterized protein